MLSELKERSQITIPKKVVVDMGLKTGDMFDVTVKQGEIHLIPVVMVPKVAYEAFANEEEALDYVNRLSLRSLDEDR
jgi:AbrB family looped-hinge helix DNA binding protein